MTLNELEFQVTATILAAILSNPNLTHTTKEANITAAKEYVRILKEECSYPLRPGSTPPGDP